MGQISAPKNQTSEKVKIADFGVCNEFDKPERAHNKKDQIGKGDRNTEATTAVATAALAVHICSLIAQWPQSPRNPTTLLSNCCSLNLNI